MCLGGISKFYWFYPYKAVTPIPYQRDLFFTNSNLCPITQVIEGIFGRTLKEYPITKLFDTCSHRLIWRHKPITMDKQGKVHSQGGRLTPDQEVSQGTRLLRHRPPQKRTFSTRAHLELQETNTHNVSHWCYLKKKFTQWLIQIRKIYLNPFRLTFNGFIRGVEMGTGDDFLFF